MANNTTTANIVLTLNGRQAAQVLDGLEKKAKSLTASIEKAATAGDKAKVKQLTRELNAVNKSLNQITGSATSAASVLQSLDKATPKELNKALKQLTNELNAIERGSEAWDAQIQKIKEVKAALADINESMRPDEGLMDKINGWWEKWQNAIVGAGAVVTGLVMAGRQAVNAYAEMEQEMANVRKFTGMSADEVERLNEEFKKIDTRTNREDLNKLAQEAGRLGKTSVEDVLGFVRAADKINVALDDLGDGATLTLSKLTGIFGDEKRLGTERSLLAVGSVINELSQNCSASAPYLAEFASRMGGVGSQAGLTVQQIMAFGAVLDSNNQACEASATALSQVITRIYQEPEKYAKVAGVNVEKFTKLVKTDMNAALIEFFSTLHKAGSMKVLSPMFRDMGENGARAISAMSTLAARIADVTWQQENARVAFDEATSITKEFDVQNNTVQAGLEKAQYSVHELAVALGEKLQPAMRFCISSTTTTLKVMMAAVDFFIKYRVEILSAVTAIAAYSAVMLVLNTRTLVAAAATKAFNAALAFGSKAVPALRLLLVPLINTVQYFTNGLEVNYAMQQRWRKALNAMNFANWLGLVLAVAAAVYSVSRRMKENREETERLRKEQEDYAESLRNIDEGAAEYSSKEIARLEAIYRAANDEKKSKKERIKAAEELQRLYPDVFKNFSTEQIMLGQTAKAYNKLRDSILEVARARAAADRIVENQKELLTLQEQAVKLKNKMDAAQADYNKAVAALDSAREQEATRSTSYGNSTDAAISHAVNLSSYEDDVVEKGRAYEEARSAYTANLNKQNTVNKSTKWLQTTYKGATDHLPKPEELTDPEMPDVPNSGAVSGTGGGLTPDRFAAEKEWRDKEEALARIKYAKGETDYITHTERMAQIQAGYYDRLLNRTDLSESERLEFQAGKLEAEEKQREQQDARTIEQEETRYNAQLAQLKQWYIDGAITKETFDYKTEEAEIAHWQKIVDLAQEGSRERLQAEDRLSQLLITQLERRQAEFEAREKEFAELKREFFGDSLQDRQEGFNNALAALQVVYDREIAAAGDNAAERLRIEEAFQQAKLVLKQKYGLLSESEEKNMMQRWAENASEWLERDGGKALKGSVDTLISGMSAVFSQVSALTQAELEVETAAINKRYDAEIEAAEGNADRIKLLERQKQADLAKVKNEANRKLFGMQIIQAVAQTAQNALAAYGSAAGVPLVGYILAPIAAAMAVAAGAVQIAAIKKQQTAAEAQGYRTGGFTPMGAPDEVAGVVHKGEWVASQSLVNNPRTRPLLEALDYAQRTNTVGSIRMADVSRSLSAPMLAYPQSQDGPVISLNPTVVVEQNQEYVATMSRLAKRLEQPFVTVATVTGDFGIKKAQEEYGRLLKNKSPK